MTGKFLKLKSLLTDNTYFRRNLILTLVALVEIFAIMIVSTSAWVETISTVQIGGGEATGKIAAPVMTTATFDGTYTGDGELDLSEYFSAAGNVHLASASSVDGQNMFFPKLNTTPVQYRKGTVNDINVNYISFSIIIDATKSSGSLNFFFKQDPTITIGGTEVKDSSIRLAITKEGASAKVFSKSESASNAVTAEDGTKESTAANTFLNYVQMSDDQTPIFDVEYGKTATVTFTLWLEDPEMNSSLTGKSVQIENLALVTDTKEYVVSFVDKTTSFYNGGVKNGLYWVSNDEALLWAYNAGAGKAIQMKKADGSNTWSANLQEFLQYKDSDLYFLRTSKDATAPTPTGTDTYNKWKTKLSYDTSLGKTFTAYSNVVNSGENLGTWGKVSEILLDTEDSTTLPYPASGSDHNAADIAMTISGVSYEMNYKNYNGTALWRCYIPDEKLADTATFSFTRNGTNYTFSADHRGDSLKYIITSSNTGYWVPPAVIKIVVDNNIDDGTVLGTASASVGNYRGTEIKVTPGTEVTLNSSDSNNYRFMGWFTKSDYTISADYLLTNGNKFTPTESDTYTFYAKFLRQYHIQLTAVTGDQYPTTAGGTVQLKSGEKTDKVDTFLLDDGEDNANVKFNAEISEPKGYEFRGWFDNASGTGKAASTELTYDVGTVKRDYTLYAKFVPKEFSVQAVAKPGDATDGMGDSTVTFSEPTGANVSTTVEVKVLYKNKAKFVANPDTANGYRFAGWYTDETLNNKIEGAAAEYEMTITEPTTLYAKFELIDVTLTAKAVTGTSESADGGTVKITGGTAAESGASDNITVKYGKPVTLKATPKYGYKFIGWYTKATGGSAVTGIAESKTYTDAEITLSGVKNTTTVYARFAPVAFKVTAVAKPTNNIGGSTVTFSEPTGANVSTTVDVQVLYNNNAKFLAKPDTENGYKFAGWYTDEALNKKIEGAAEEYEMKITKPTTLYAKFELIDVTLTAKAVTGTSESADGGNVKITNGTASTAGASDTITVKYGSSVTLTATPKDGYEFKGWYTEATGGSGLSGIADSKTYTDTEITLSSIKADAIVYARFAPKNRVYFANNVVDSNNSYSATQQWNTPYCYVWQKSNTANNNNWPGGKMTYDSELGLYYYDITNSGVDKVIFSGKGKNNTGYQTEDLDLVLGATYYLQAKQAGSDKYPATTNKTITLVDNTKDNWITYPNYFIYLYDKNSGEHYDATVSENKYQFTVPSTVTNICFYRCEGSWNNGSRNDGVTNYSNKLDAGDRENKTIYTVTGDYETYDSQGLIGVGTWS